MSAEAVGWVFRHSPYKGSLFQVHLAVADSVNDQNGNKFWLSQGNLAKKTRLTRKAAGAALGTLVADGYLRELRATSTSHGGRGVRNFRFLFPDVDVVYETRSVPDDDEDDEALDPNASPVPIGNDGPMSTEDATNEYGGRNQCAPSTHKPNRSQEEPNSSRKGRPNPPWDAIVEVVGWSPSTRTERTRVGKAVREVTEALVAESPERDWNPENVAKAIRARAGRYRAEWPTAELTPEALVKHWSKFGPGRSAAPAVPGSAPPDREVIREMASRGAEAEFKLYLRGFRSDVDLTMAEQWFEQGRREAAERKAAGG